MCDGVGTVTSNVHSLIELLGSHGSIDELVATEVINSVLKEARNVVDHRVEKDWDDEVTGLDVVLLDEERKSDGQKSFDRDCDGGVTGAS